MVKGPAWLDAVRYQTATICQSNWPNRVVTRGDVMARPRPEPLNDVSFLRREYVEKGRRVADIAAELGCADATVRRALNRHGLPRRTVRPSQLNDRQWLTRAYHEEGRACRSIAMELGCSPAMVLDALRRMGIGRRPKRPVPSDKLQDGAYLFERYWEERLSIVAIARGLQCSPGAVRRAMHRHGIEVRRSGPPRIDQLYDDDWLERAVRDQRKTPDDIARSLGCSVVTVRWALWRASIPPGPGVPRRPAELDEPSFLRQEYVERGRTLAELAGALGCSATTVDDALRRHGISARPPANVPRRRG